MLLSRRLREFVDHNEPPFEIIEKNRLAELLIEGGFKVPRNLDRLVIKWDTGLSGHKLTFTCWPTFNGCLAKTQNWLVKRLQLQRSFKLPEPVVGRTAGDDIFYMFESEAPVQARPAIYTLPVNNWGWMILQDLVTATGKEWNELLRTYGAAAGTTLDISDGTTLEKVHILDLILEIGKDGYDNYHAVYVPAGWGNRLLDACNA